LDVVQTQDHMLIEICKIPNEKCDLIEGEPMDT